MAVHVTRIQNAQFDDEGQAVLRIQQRSQVRGKLARQHREGRHPGIDRGGLRRRLAVRGRPFGDGGINVGNAHQQPRGAAGQSFDVFDLVQVPRAVIVNRGPEQRTQVADCRPVGLWRALLQELHLMEHVRRKVRPESRLQHGLMRAGFKINRSACHAAILIRPPDQWQWERDDGLNANTRTSSG